MNLIRKLKISKITKINFTKKELEIIQFMDNNLSDLICYYYKDNDYICYIKNDSCKLTLINKDVIYCSRVFFYDILTNICHSNEEHIKNLIKEFFKYYYKINIRIVLTSIDAELNIQSLWNSNKEDFTKC